jgi:hypothetical protein
MSCKRRHRPKGVLQRAIVAHLTARAAPELRWHHVPISGFRPVEGAILKGRGLRKGAPDSLTNQQPPRAGRVRRALF